MKQLSTIFLNQFIRGEFKRFSGEYVSNFITCYIYTLYIYTFTIVFILKSITKKKIKIL